MIQDTLQRLQEQHTPATQATTVGIELSAEQARALDAILTALDQPGPRRAIGLFGAPGSGKTLLLNELCKDGLRAKRTPQHRRVVCAIINAANLPADLTPWQRLIFGTLDKLAQQPGAPSTIHDLRAELEEVVQHEANDDPSATLAAAAFAHHMRAAFAGLIHSAITLSNATFVVAVDHIDKASPDGAAQLLEASKYFLNAQNCTVLICADEVALTERLGDASMLQMWLTGRVELRASAKPTLRELAIATPATAPRTPPRPIASDIPQPCVQVFAKALGDDRYAMELAGDYWRSAMRALAKRNAEGYRTDISGAMIAKLCALRVLSPGLFDAVRLDAPALTMLERRARTQDAVYDGRDEWAEALARDLRLARLFTAAPSFIGVETRHLATALRLVHTGDAELINQTRSLLTQPAPAAVELASSGTFAAATPVATPAAPVKLDRPRPHRQPTLVTLLAPIWTLVSAAAIVFIVDRLIKMAVQSIEGFQTGTTIFAGLVRLRPPAEASLTDISLSVGVELLGLALCILIAIFALRQTDSVRARAFGLIVGGLAAQAFDRVTFGVPMNYVHVGSLPVFNLAHLALLAGAALLAYALLADLVHDASNRAAKDLTHE